MTTSKTKTQTKGPGNASGEEVEVDKRAIWIGGGIILVLGGVAIWIIAKKKKERKRSGLSTTTSSGASAASGRFRCTSSSYPLQYGTCHTDVGILQRYLKSFNHPLGTSGKNRDGVDGQFGPMTRTAARKQLGKESFLASDIEGMKKALNFVG